MGEKGMSFFLGKGKGFVFWLLFLFFFFFCFGEFWVLWICFLNFFVIFIVEEKTIETGRKKWKGGGGGVKWDGVF
ncbi:MAG: hypothetical protein IPI42_03705 [Saprospiraceae bacterium]|nr:hypothetical protein [Candidatus Parvibacillus calidus]